MALAQETDATPPLVISPLSRRPFASTQTPRPCNDGNGGHDANDGGNDGGNDGSDGSDGNDGNDGLATTSSMGLGQLSQDVTAIEADLDKAIQMLAALTAQHATGDGA